MTRPTAAKGTFPYPHRTVAEMDAASRGVIRHWCDQCMSRASAIEAATCGSHFCKHPSRPVPQSHRVTKAIGR